MNDTKKNMTKKERLQEEQEELFFKKMFAAFDEADAPKYEALNEQLKNDPAYDTTEEQDKAMLEFIAREIAKRDAEFAKAAQNHRESTKPAPKKSVRYIKTFFKTVAVIVAVLAFITVVSYAAIPTFQVKVLNLLLEASDIATRLEITDNAEITDRRESLDGTDIVMLGYRFPGVPEGFDREEEFIDQNDGWIRYTSEQGKTIKYQVFCGVERDVALDTEDANAKDILIHDQAGLLTKKGDTINVSWYDEENKTYFIIIANGLDAQFVFNLANEVTKAE